MLLLFGRYEGATDEKDIVVGSEQCSKCERACSACYPFKELH